MRGFYSGFSVKIGIFSGKKYSLLIDYKVELCLDIGKNKLYNRKCRTEKNYFYT